MQHQGPYSRTSYIAGFGLVEKTNLRHYPSKFRVSNTDMLAFFTVQTSTCHSEFSRCFILLQFGGDGTDLFWFHVVQYQGVHGAFGLHLHGVTGLQGLPVAEPLYLVFGLGGLAGERGRLVLHTCLICQWYLERHRCVWKKIGSEQSSVECLLSERCNVLIYIFNLKLVDEIKKGKKII